MPHRVPFTGESERRFDARQAATVASLTRRSHAATYGNTLHEYKTAYREVTVARLMVNGLSGRTSMKA